MRIKIFKQKYLNGIRDFVFIDEKTFYKNEEDLFIRTYGMNVAIIIVCEDELGICVLKNRKFRDYHTNKTLLPFLLHKYSSFQNKYLQDYVNRLGSDINLAYGNKEELALVK